MTTQAPSEARYGKTLAVCAIVAALTVIVYLPSLRFALVDWDDRDLVADNPLVAMPTGQNLKLIWTRPYLGLYTPLSYTLWWTLSRMRGRVVVGDFHAANLAMHVAAAVLVFSILRRCLPKHRLAAAAGTVVFALHPLQVEAVAWVSGMNNLLAAALVLLALRLYIAHVQARTRGRRAIFYVGATAAFCLALLSKPTAVVAPLLAIVLDRVVARRSASDSAISAGPWLAISAAFAFLARAVQPAVGPAMLYRPIIAMDALAFYLGKLACPKNLTIDYARSPAAVLDGHSWIATCVVTILVTALSWAFRRRAWAMAVGAALAVAALLPTLGLAPFDFQRFSTVADRYCYLAMLGAALAAAWLASQVHNRTVAVCVAGLLGLMVWRTSVQLRIWRDTGTLISYVLALDPLSTMGNRIAAEQEARTGDWVSAAMYDRVALRRNPDDADLQFNLANALRNSGDPRGSIEHYQRAINLGNDRVRPGALNNLGVAYVEMGQMDRAAEMFVQALQIDPDDALAKQNLAAARAKTASRP